MNSISVYTLLIALVLCSCSPVPTVSNELAKVANHSERLEGVMHDISISGVIGSEFTAREFSSRLAIGDRFAKKADIIVLCIDSPGGSVTEMEKIVRSILSSKSKRFVAVVEKALSSVAVVALACDTIYMTPGSRIGAATPYLMNTAGEVITLPPAIEEKQFSAMRALVRIAARNGGYSAVLAEAMVDPDIELRLSKADGMPVLRRDGNGSIMSQKGEVLTLTAGEAVDCGLARALDEDWADLFMPPNKVVPLSHVADDALDNFSSDLSTQYIKARFEKAASKGDAEQIARAWAKENHANAPWLRRPVPILVRKVLANRSATHPYSIEGESLLSPAHTIVASIEDAPAFVPYIQKGDVVMIEGRLDFDRIWVSPPTRVLIGFTDCRCTLP